MFIVPMMLFSWALADEVVAESTTSRVSTTVSISAASTTRRSSACWAPTFTYSVRSSSTLGLLVVDADHGLDLGKGLERLSQAPAPVGGQPGEQDPPRVHGYPNQTDLRSASMPQRPSWMRARTSWATVCTSALSSGESPSANSMGSRKRSLNLAGR